MIALPRAVVVALVRGWTRFYTAGLPSDSRTRRRQEIESDLWESFNDSSARAVALSQLWRLITGIPDDLGWRAEQPRPTSAATFAILFTGICALLLLGLLSWAGTAASLPLPMPISRDQADRRSPPPPPPPPPPPFQRPSVR